MVCDKAWYKGTSDAMLMVGVMMGSIIFGYLSDKWVLPISIGFNYVGILNKWVQIFFVLI